jgi:hypothetical protein
MPYSLQRTFLPAVWRWRVRLDGARPLEGYAFGKVGAKRAAARVIGRLRHSKQHPEAGSSQAAALELRVDA